jgi:hypothetical protein
MADVKRTQRGYGGGGALQSAAEIYETTKVHSQPDFQSLDKKKIKWKLLKKIKIL